MSTIPITIVNAHQQQSIGTLMTKTYTYQPPLVKISRTQKVKGLRNNKHGIYNYHF